MKRLFGILFSLFIIVTVQFVFPKNTLAQGVFNCNYTLTICRGPALISNPCDSGYEPDYSICTKFDGDPAGCSSQTGLTCIKRAGTGDINIDVNPTESNIYCQGGTSLRTAIGCIPINDQTAFIGWILGWSIGIGGGIAFLLILYAGFQITTSQGDPKKLQAGQELLTSAISGLILLIFSVFILRVIGVDILKIPGL